MYIRMLGRLLFLVSVIGLICLCVIRISVRYILLRIKIVMLIIGLGLNV